MLIGIAVKIEYSLFSSGAANAALAIAEMCENLGHNVILVNTSNISTDWWIDCISSKAKWEHRIKSLKDKTWAKLDILFEIDSQAFTANDRRRAAAHCIWLVRHSALIHETEAAIFPIVTNGYTCDGISEVWMWDLNSTEDDRQIMETITRAPCRRVPFLWTPIINVHFEKVYNVIPWLKTTTKELLEKGGVVDPWKLHIAESNKGSHSSCILPLFIARESGETSWTVHNAQQIIKSPFFRRNIVTNACLPLTGGKDISGVFVGRHRAVDWALEPMSYVISHGRFEGVRPFLLDLIWFGIPVVHNSPALSDLSGGWSKMYYSGNEISGACRALKEMKSDFCRMSGIFQKKSLDEVRKNLVERFSPLGEKPAAGWEAALSGKIGLEKSSSEKKPLKIRFCDMWEQFNPSHNFFTLLLESDCRVETEFSDRPDLVIFGPFGETWREYPEVPKVFFTGENLPSIMDPSVLLNLTFELSGPSNQIRFPLWMMEIDWFGADLGRIQNPKPIPLDICTEVQAELLARKKKFCAFVVSNPKNEIRNAAFHWLSQYKRVDSAGGLFNNMGGILDMTNSLGPSASTCGGGPSVAAVAPCGGGGGGELAKVEFLRDYKFCLVFENASSPGYTTEKLLHAKAAGCIPIYWGDSEVQNDFDLNGIIDARGVTSSEDLIRLVRAVDESDSEWLRRFSVPALSEERAASVRQTMSKISERILDIAWTKVQPPVPENALPPVPENALPPVTENPPPPVPENAPTALLANKILAISYTSKKFLHCLPIWLKSILTQPQLTARIYLASDVPAASERELRSGYPTVDFRNIPIAPPEGAWQDFWAPEHFAWKLWILAGVVAEPAGQLVLYMDIATFLSRLPAAWIARASSEGLCFLEDRTQINRNWCHHTFVTALRVAKHELDAYQLWAGASAFMTGSIRAKEIFSQAFELSKRREIITGAKWITPTTGHRHDQSILSIISARAGAARYPYDAVVGTSSLRRTFQAGLAIYLHRGAFKLHVQPYKGIDEVFVISLARRPDRLQRFRSGCEPQATVIEAVDGRALTLTPALKRLLSPNDFGWKKSVAGCALSHLGLWLRLVKDNPDIGSYLILEDDAVFSEDWATRWAAAQPHLPADADVVYLGGVLPPNHGGFSAAKRPVNAFFSQMGDNTFFGQLTPNSYMHFCTYAYILTRQGASKVLEEVFRRGGIWTSADHMICNLVDRLNIYFTEPLLAKCYQEDDPKYMAADFNNFNRLDQFDSDIWNNNDKFDASGIVPGDKLDIDLALSDARLPLAKAAPIFVCTTKANINGSTQTEMAWLSYLVGSGSPAEVKSVTQLEEGQILIILTDFVEAVALLVDAEKRGVKCIVVCLADEYCTFPMEFYKLSSVKHVIRTYPRQTPVPEKVTTIPLGYYRHPPAGSRIPPISERRLDWSFMGTDWQERQSQIAILQIPELTWDCRLFKEWMDQAQVGEAEYVATMLNSKFVLCPSGHNGETYRFYEAIECGAIPLIVGELKNEPFLAFIKDNVPVIAIKDWPSAKEFIFELLKSPELMESYMGQIRDGWAKWKGCLVEKIRAIITPTSAATKAVVAI
jgi:GR25 family glycosyltransferase involved in LPS biosynthesis